MTNPKLISSLNSKECLRGSSATPKPGLIALLAFVWVAAWASNQAHPNAAIPSGATTHLTGAESDLVQKLKKDISEQKQIHSSFESLTKKWEKAYGIRAFQPLIHIASDSGNSDSDRYIALMNAAKIGGPGAVPELLKFLKDPSWMLRGGSLRALSVVGNSVTGESVLPLLKDPALVVRVEAVEAVRILKPIGTTEALLLTLEDKNNYHAGKAQWVPQKALLALTTLHATEAVSRLRPMLKSPEHGRDSEFRRQIEQALNMLTP